MAKALAQFTIARTGDEYLLTIEDGDGDTIELTCDYDQLDILAEEIEVQLDRDEEEMLDADEGDVDIGDDIDGDSVDAD